MAKRLIEKLSKLMNFRVNQILFSCEALRKTDTTKAVIALGQFCNSSQTGRVVVGAGTVNDLVTVLVNEF